MNTVKKYASVGAKLNRVYVVSEYKWGDSDKLLGVFSSIDSALESCYDYLELNYPNTVWMWNGDSRALENTEDDYHMLFLSNFQVDVDSWNER